MGCVARRRRLLCIIVRIMGEWLLLVRGKTGLVGCLGIRLPSGLDGCVVGLETCLYDMEKAELR